MSEVRQDGWDWREYETVASRSTTGSKMLRGREWQETTREVPVAGTKAWIMMLLLTLRAMGKLQGFE